MKVDKTEGYDIGVLVGRFQIHELHEAHKEVIQTVVDNHQKVILFLGVAPLVHTSRNPLDFDSRKKMIEKIFPDIVIAPLPDRGNDKAWSKELDSRIKEIFPMGKVLLYGGRDSFIPHYEGSFDTHELEQRIYVSATEVRNQVRHDIKSSPDYRAGVITASLNKYPIAYSTIDVVATRNDGTEFLLGRKPNEKVYRFIGGFKDPEKDNSRIDAVHREFAEETNGCKLFQPKHICELKVDDWRYRGELDKIFTDFYVAEFKGGEPRPTDDIAELRWFTLEEISGIDFNVMNIMREHQPLMRQLLTHLGVNH